MSWQKDKLRKLKAMREKAAKEYKGAMERSKVRKDVAKIKAATRQAKYGGVMDKFKKIADTVNKATTKPKGKPKSKTWGLGAVIGTPASGVIGKKKNKGMF